MATLAASPTNRANWRSIGNCARLSRKLSPMNGLRGPPAALGSGRVAGVFGVLAASINQILGQTKQQAESDRHLHDVFIGGNQLVAHLGQIGRASWRERGG